MPFNAGLPYSHSFSERMNISTGYHIRNITRTPISAISAERSETRHITYLSGAYGLADRWTLYANALYSPFLIANEYRIGAYARVELGSNGKAARGSVLYFGGSYTNYRSISPYLGFERGTLRIGLSSQQFQNEDLSLASVELSVIYTGRGRKSASSALPAIF